MNPIETEPVLSANGIVALVSAVLVLAIAFGIPISDAQRTAILGAVAVIAPLIAAWWIRSRVTPLVKPQDSDGTALVRKDGSMPIEQMRSTLRGD